MTEKAVKKLLFEKVTSGKIFSVAFYKRTTGEYRVMLCRGGVRKYLKGGLQKFDPQKYNLMVVFDMQKLEYKCIPIERIMFLNKIDLRC
jgi:hypothetical protein